MDCLNYQNKNSKKITEVGDDVFQLLLILLEIEMHKQVN